ncbi:MAG: TonB-dependent receptor [Sedimentisphaerales bacterium]|nr:TonB-dependent receptor [Sedimentisphaerales bacterium]
MGDMAWVDNLHAGLQTWICWPLVLVVIAAGTIAATESSRPEDIFEMSLEELLNVEITTASKAQDRQSDAPGVVSVVTKDELRRFGGTTLRDVLERVPGLAGSTVYMTDRSMIAVRGDQISNSGVHVLLLINGRPVREVQEGGIKSEILETFPVEIIERIEVIKGPGSVLYGSTAFAGVINVITEKGDQDRISLTAMPGEAGALGTAGTIKIRSEDLKVIAAARYLDKADWRVNYVAASDGSTITRPMRIPNTGTGTYLGIDYGDLSLMLAHNTWETAYFIPDFMSLFETYGVSRWQKTFLNIGYQRQIAGIWRSDMNLTLTQSGFETSSWPNIRRDSSETLFEWTNFVRLSGGSQLVFGTLLDGIEGSEVDPSSGAVWSDGARTDLGIYAQMDHQLTSQIKLIGGVQANKIENLDWDMVPRVGFIWSPMADIFVKVLYGQAFRAPSINENFLNHPGLRGNPNLDPEKVATVDLSVGYYGTNKELVLSCFRSRLTDIIYQDRTGFPTYANRADTITIEGMELEGKYYLNRAIFLTGSIMYQESQDDEGNKDLAPIANISAKGGISYVWPGGLTVGLFDVFQGPLDRKYQATLNPCPGSYNKLSLHCELDLKKFLNYKAGVASSLIIQVDNLLDEQIWLPNWGLLPGQSIPYDQGRAIYAGLNLRF